MLVPKPTGVVFSIVRSFTGRGIDHGSCRQGRVLLVDAEVPEFDSRSTNGLPRQALAGY
jgi:hypothetical protein